jgi:hypothetical protein
VEILQQLREMKGVAGIHVMAYRQEEWVAEIVERSGVLKGRKPWRKEVNPGDYAVAEAMDNLMQENI